MTDINRYKLSQSLKECQLHLKRINFALNNIKEIFPLSTEAYKQLNDQNIEHIDQFIYRFNKLQDAMGLRLFPSILSSLGEDVSTKPFIDRLNRLHQLEVIDNISKWGELKELRNQLAHEYPDEEDIIVQNLNELHVRVHDLIQMLEQTDKYIARKLS